MAENNEIIKENGINNKRPIEVVKLRRIVFHYDCLYGKTNRSCINEVKYCFREEYGDYEKIFVTPNFFLLLKVLRNKLHDMKCDYCIPETYYNNDMEKEQFEQIADENDIWSLGASLKEAMGSEYNIVVDTEYYLGGIITDNARLKPKVMKTNITVVDNLKFENLFNVQDIESYTPDLVISTVKDFFKKIEKSKRIFIHELKDNIQFSRAASAQLLQLFIQYFYADNIYSKSSTLSIADIGNRKFSKMDLVSYPFSKNMFDADGIQTKKKYLVRQGVVKNILSNKMYSRMLDREDAGNADFYDENKITHQRLVLRINEVLPQSESVIVEKFIKIGIIEGDKVRVSCLGYYHNQYIILKCRLNLMGFFENAKAYDFQFEPVGNVLLQELVISVENLKTVFQEIQN